MRLNPDKCAFRVEGGKFFSSLFTHHDIEANPEKCWVIIEMWSPENVRGTQRLIGLITTLSRFVPKLAERTKPIVQLLWKAAKFQWTDECEGIFLQLKAFLVCLHPPMEPITVFLVISKDAISASLVQGVEKIGKNSLLHQLSASRRQGSIPDDWEGRVGLSDNCTTNAYVLL